MKNRSELATPSVDRARTQSADFPRLNGAAGGHPCRPRVSFSRSVQPDVSSPIAPWSQGIRGPHNLQLEPGGGNLMHHFVAVAASLVMPTHTGAEATQLILRWF